MTVNREESSRLSHADQAGFLIIGQGLGLVIAVLSPVVITRLVSQDDYGTYRQLLLLSALITPNVTLGLPNAILYFYARSRGNTQRLLVLQSTLLLVGAGVLSGAVLAALAAPLARGFRNPPLAALMPVFALYAGILIATRHVYQILVVQQQVRRAALYGAGVTAIPTLAAIGVGLATRTVRGLTIGLSAGAAVILVLGAWVIGRRLSRPEEDPSDGDMSGRELLRVMAAYGLPIGLSVGVIALGRYVDQIMVSALSTPALFAIYSIGWVPVRMSSTLLTAVGTALVPVWSERAHREAFAECMALSRQASRRVGLISLPGMAVLCVAAPDLVPLLFSEQYAAAVPVFRASLLVLAAQIFLPEALLSGLGRTGVLLIGSSISVVLGSALVAGGIHLLGLTGAALGAAASAFLVRCYYGVAIRRTVGHDAGPMLPWPDLARVFLGAAGAGILAGAVAAVMHPGMLRLSATLATYAVGCTALMVVTGALTDSDRAMVRRWLDFRFILGRSRR